MRNDPTGMGHTTSTRPNRSRIHPVQAALPQERLPTWVNVLKAFNPIGPLADSFAEVLAHRIEAKRLSIELERVRKEASLHEQALDASLKLQMEDLDQRRLALDRYFDTVQQQLQNLHVERMTILRMAEEANRRALEPGLQPEERACYKEMVLELSRTIPVFGQTAGQNLETLLRALPSVQLPRDLLPAEGA